MQNLFPKLTAKELLKDLAYDIVGSLLIAVGIYNFALYANLPLAGISGICLILYKLTGLPIGLGTVMLNIPIAALCYKLLGHHFFLRSIKSMLISSFFIDVVAPLFPVYQGDRLLAAVCTGVISALGYALIYLRSSSTGGSDFVIMSVKALKPHLSLGNITFAIDGAIILVGGLMFSDTDGIIYGIMMSYLMSMVIDKVMYGVDRGKVALIVTEHGEEIAFEVERLTGRGATFLKAQGSFSKLDKQVVMVACDNKEMFRVQQVAKQCDPKSFTVVLESSEVLGEGFKVG
ncbi:MAG: YitT family protein [Clostridia bacterium]|nr:YitT family protein [Clostridia bacterium]